MRTLRALHAGERGLARATRALARPGAQHAAVAALVLLALVVRLPLLVAADDVPTGHNDANIYFNHVYTVWLRGDPFPDHDRGSGWNILLYWTLQAFDVPPGDWIDKGQADLSPEQARAVAIAYGLSTMLSVGMVAATWLLARQVLPAAAALLATALVALDPYLLFITTSSMSEPPYTTVLVLALAFVLKARRSHPAWLVGAGAMMALAHVMRVNGIVMFVTVLVFALLLLPRTRRTWMWTGATVAAFALVAAPYLAWRATDGPGAFEYGTNQRFWADDLWDMDDAYWQARMSGDPDPPKETLADYARDHTWGDAIGRLWVSVQWQLFDLFGYGKWPAGEREGGAWPGSPPDGSALTPLLTGLALAAALLVRRRELAFLPLALAFTFATFTWIYPLVRSVRYFAPLIPLFAVVAVAGWLALSARVRWPRLAALALFGTYFALYGARLLVAAPEAAAGALANPDWRALIAVFTAGWLLLALAPLWSHLARRRVRSEETATDAA